MTVYRAEPSPTKRGTIAALLKALHAPEWAAPNLDGLADVLRDLSWLPEEPIDLHWHIHPDLDNEIQSMVHAVLEAAEREAKSSKRPIRFATGNQEP
jgi:hypothetical protein